MKTILRWDPMKNLANLRKHGIDFERALRVFADPLGITERDHIERGEERWRTVGRAGGLLLLLVVHTNAEEDRDQQPS